MEYGKTVAFSFRVYGQYCQGLTGEMKARTQPQEKVYFNNKIKQRPTKTTPKGENRQADRELLHSQHNTHT